MTNLATVVRPQVVFDPTNTDHRKWAGDFIKNRSWRNCPVRFIVSDTSLDIAGVIQRQLVEFYINQEFSN